MTRILKNVRFVLVGVFQLFSIFAFAEGGISSGTLPHRIKQYDAVCDTKMTNYQIRILTSTGGQQHRVEIYKMNEGNLSFVKGFMAQRFFTAEKGSHIRLQAPAFSLHIRLDEQVVNSHRVLGNASFHDGFAISDSLECEL